MCGAVLNERRASRSVAISTASCMYVQVRLQTSIGLRGSKQELCSVQMKCPGKLEASSGSLSRGAVSALSLQVPDPITHLR